MTLIDLYLTHSFDPGLFLSSWRPLSLSSESLHHVCEANTRTRQMNPQGPTIDEPVYAYKQLPPHQSNI